MSVEEETHAMTTLLHLVYIHGFQGNDTSFQAFPLHLQERITARIPPESKFRVQSSLYPTYKSVKPLSHATKAFLEWLATQPEGPVILMGHSMGGLLAAEAALHPSNHPDPSISSTRPRRIVGIIAFDVPLLGMHPHVVVSGIASLLPKGGGKDDKKAKLDRKLDEHPQIQVVHANVTDEWEAFKKKINRKSQQGRSPLPDATPSYLELPSRGSSPTPSTQEAEGSSLTSSTRSRSRSPSPFLDRAIDFVASHTDPEDPVVRWLRKHQDDPLRASKRWVVERFQFGSCMFDPSGLKERYLQLLQWRGGLWVNYWSQTLPRTKAGQPITLTKEEQQMETVENDAGLVEAGLCSPEDGLRRQHDVKHKGDEEIKPPRHFVLLPKGLGDRFGGMERWEKVVIAGVDDEVEAHTGLFIPSSNLDYDRFVDRVADRILAWGQTLV